MGMRNYVEKEEFTVIDGAARAEEREDSRQFLAKLRDELVSIEEYWNGHHNESATLDAAITMREKARWVIGLIDARNAND